MNTRTLYLENPMTPLRPGMSLGADFVRGMVATGIVAAVQERGKRPVFDRRTTRLALQGGTALATGSSAARLLQTGQTALALANITAGVLAVVAIENLMQESKGEKA